LEKCPVPRVKVLEKALDRCILEKNLAVLKKMLEARHFFASRGEFSSSFFLTVAKNCSSDVVEVFVRYGLLSIDSPMDGNLSCIEMSMIRNQSDAFDLMVEYKYKYAAGSSEALAIRDS